jgi:hypothetical protein
MTPLDSVPEPPRADDDLNVIPPAIADQLRRLTEVQENLAGLARAGIAPAPDLPGHMASPSPSNSRPARRGLRRRSR